VSTIANFAKLRLVKLDASADGTIDVPVEDPEVLERYGAVVQLMTVSLKQFRNAPQRRQFLALVRDHAIQAKDSLDFGRLEAT
jgi:hypothetical protein